MASTGTVTLNGNVSGGPAGTRSFGPNTVPLNTAVDQTLVTALASGANTVTVPTGSTVCIIVGPNATSPNPLWAGVLTVKGVAGDTGVVVSAKFPTMLSWDTAPASFVLNASITGATVEFWFA